MSKRTPERSELSRRDTWQLEDIYATNADWEADYAAASEKIKSFAAYSGKLVDISALKEALDVYYSISYKIENLFTYARMRRDEDNRNAEYQALVDRAQSLMVSAGSSAAFLTPELLSQPDGYLSQAAESEGFEIYQVFLKNLERRRPHTLSAAEEKLVAMTGEMGAAPDTIFSMLTDADMKFPVIEDEDGHSVELTQSNFISFMMSRNRSVRRAAFDALYSTYRKYSSTIPAIYSSSVKSDVFYAAASKHESALKAALFPDNVPEEVYNNLIDSVHRHLPALNRFLKRNGELIGLKDEVSMIDIYVPAVDGFDIKLPFDEAYRLVTDCLKPLGEDYQEVLRQAREERWIDPFENVGKSSGAYSWGTYDSHPFVLLNYKENLDSLLTIAHEMGHAMHSYYSDKTQPRTTAGYSLFVAEVASTCNEILVLFELMERYKDDKKAQAFLVYQLLDGFRGTVFRQTMFAEFERASHAMAERGEALTAESLNKVYAELNASYYSAMAQEKMLESEWMRIPHFYRAFYVYKYATGFSAAMALATAIRKEGAPAVERYRKFLSLGGSMYPIDLLKVAGVDMSNPESVDSALNVFDELVARYEELTADSI